MNKAKVLAALSIAMIFFTPNKNVYSAHNSSTKPLIQQMQHLTLLPSQEQQILKKVCSFLPQADIAKLKQINKNINSSSSYHTLRLNNTTSQETRSILFNKKNTAKHPNITVLFLQNCEVPTNTINAVVQHYPNLKKLIIDGFLQQKNQYQSFSVTIANHQNLECIWVRNAPLQTINVKNCNNLKTFAVEQCDYHFLQTASCIHKGDLEHVIYNNSSYCSYLKYGSNSRPKSFFDIKKYAEFLHKRKSNLKQRLLNISCKNIQCLFIESDFHHDKLKLAANSVEYLDLSCFDFLGNAKLSTIANHLTNVEISNINYASLSLNNFDFMRNKANISDPFLKSFLEACKYNISTMSFNLHGQKDTLLSKLNLFNHFFDCQYKSRYMPRFKPSAELQQTIMAKNITLVPHALRCTPIDDLIKNNEHEEKDLVKYGVFDEMFVENEFDGNNMLSSYLQ